MQERMQYIISHMNNHHKGELESLVMANVENFGTISDVELIGADLEGLDIGFHNDGERSQIRVNFAQKATPETMKDAIIKLCMNVGASAKAPHNAPDSSNLSQEITAFERSFGSAVLATLSPSGQALATYAPIIHSDERVYIYISEVAEHFASIQANPSNIELLFLEDESKAHSVILRKRLRYRVSARFIQRDSDEFEKVFDNFLRQNNNNSAIKSIKVMSDFHLIELQKGDGRYVKGFGQAYALHNGTITHIGGGNPNNPHAMPHKMPH